MDWTVNNECTLRGFYYSSDTSSIILRILQLIGIILVFIAFKEFIYKQLNRTDLNKNNVVKYADEENISSFNL